MGDETSSSPSREAREKWTLKYIRIDRPYEPRAITAHDNKPVVNVRRSVLSGDNKVCPKTITHGCVS